MITNKYFLGQNYFLIVILFEASNKANDHLIELHLIEIVILHLIEISLIT
jgi:hypothetical protein